MATGSNHLLLLGKNGQLYGLGSNDLGQLGVPDSILTNYDEHPLTLEKLYYTASPVLIPIFNG